MENKYTNIENRYMAEGLAFLGFKYYKYGQGREIIYSFQDTKEFKTALAELTQLRKKYNKVN